MTFAPLIESGRVLLRPFEVTDCEAVLEYQSNPDCVRYVPWPVRDASMVEEAIAKDIERIRFAVEGDYLSLALVRRSDGRLLGQVNAMYASEEDQCAEIGYVVSPTYAGQGFATEAATTLVSALFDTGRFRRIIAQMDDRNVASRAVAEKLGFRLEAHFLEDDFFKGEWTSTLVYATLSAEWSRRERRTVRQPAG